MNSPTAVGRSPVVLRAAALRGHDLADSLAEAGMMGGTALLCTPTAYLIAMVDGGTLVPAPGTCAEDRVPLGDVFDARVFDGDVEFRWVKTDGDLGSAVLLSEDPARLPLGFGEPAESVDAYDHQDGRYLLWGWSLGPRQDGWTTLTTARIGRLQVPAAIPARGRAHLSIREYAVRDDHGNVRIAEERLLCLTKRPETPRRPKDIMQDTGQDGTASDDR